MLNTLRNILTGFFIVLLSTLIPGSGLYLSGRKKQGGIIYGFLLLESVLFLTLFYPHFIHLVIFVLFAGLIHAVSLIFTVARLFKHRPGPVQPGNLWRSGLLMVAVHAGVVLPLLFLVLSPLKPFRVPTDSMIPTLTPGDYFLIDKSYYSDHRPERGDIVVFFSDTNRKYFVKRVVGLPRESIRALSGGVFINGQQIKESYPGIDFPIQDYSGFDIVPVYIPPNSIFVLGDNRENSYDSRYSGPVDISSLKGKALYITGSSKLERIGKKL